jgi:hypothetical protein
MSLVQDLTPINIQEQRKRFFEEECNYNPHFKYNTLITLRKRFNYGKPKPKFIKLAKRILARSLKQRSEHELRAKEGKKIDRQTGQAMIDQFLAENNLEKEIEIHWIPDHISKASHYQGKLKLRQKFDYRSQKFLDTLYHEIGTHALRRINYAQQPFFQKKDQFGFKEYLFAEEGLASLHSLLARNYQVDYYHALMYLAVEKSLQGSFVDTFRFINQYLQDKLRSWRLTIKFKRGMYDTSKPGGFTKGIVYLEGMVRVWHYFQSTDFDLPGLYWGKIDVKDVKKARELNPNFQPKLPSFYIKNIEQYKKQIKHIAKLNYLGETI